jgi:anthranilate synthase component 1
VITELEFKSLAAQGFNRIPLIAEAFADLETPLSLYLKLAGGSAQLPARIGGRRRALRPLFVHRPAGAHAAARHRLPAEVVTDGQVVDAFEGNPLDFIAPTRRASRWRCARAAALLRRAGRLLRLRRRALHRAAAGRHLESPAASARPTSCCCRPRNWRSSTTCRAGCT